MESARFFVADMMNPLAKKWITFSVRWGIAALGIWYVLAQTPFHDQLLLYDKPTHQLLHAQVLHEPQEDADAFEVINPLTKKTEMVPRGEVWTKPDVPKIKIRYGDGFKRVKLLAIRPGILHQTNAAPQELLIISPDSGKPLAISSAKAPGYKVHTPYPLVDIGVVRLVEGARLHFLLAALLVLPVSFVITSRRWHMLLAALDIQLSQFKTLILNLVGSFYNSFMPGSTGGDLIKAYYASRHTTHKIRAVLSVIIDRLIGVFALIILGGAMCLTQWQVPDCQKVGIVSGCIILFTVVGLVVYYHRGWRKATGLEWLIHHMPMQRQIHHVVEAMDLYGKRPKVAFAALVMTFPVHMTTIVCGTLIGMAFHLDMNKMPWIYYWTVIPVITLVAAIPISPQGAGVMEYFAVQLTKNHGVTVSQAIALAMGVRFAQMFWNLVAGLAVLRGGYHAPTAKDQEDMETDEDEPPAASLSGEPVPSAIER